MMPQSLKERENNVKTNKETEIKKPMDTIGSKILKSIQSTRNQTVKPTTDVFLPGRSSYVFNISQILVRYFTDIFDKKIFFLFLFINLL